MFFICIHYGLHAILEKCRQQLGKRVSHWGLTDIVGALFGRTICDHPLKSLLIYCGCLFSEISRPLFCHCQHFDQSAGAALYLHGGRDPQNESTKQIRHWNVTMYSDGWCVFKANTSLDSLLPRYFRIWRTPPSVEGAVEPAPRSKGVVKISEI